jgi:hypothetical protein
MKEQIKKFMMKIYYHDNHITAVTINNYQKLTIKELAEIKYRIDYLYNDKKENKKPYTTEQAHTIINALIHPKPKKDQTDPRN